MMGAYRYTLLRTGRLEAMSGGACDSGDFDRAVAEIVPFLVRRVRPLTAANESVSPGSRRRR